MLRSMIISFTAGCLFVLLLVTFYYFRYYIPEMEGEDILKVFEEKSRLLLEKDFAKSSLTITLPPRDEEFLIITGAYRNSSSLSILGTRYGLNSGTIEILAETTNRQDGMYFHIVKKEEVVASIHIGDIRLENSLVVLDLKKSVKVLLERGKENYYTFILKCVKGSDKYCYSENYDR